MAGYTALRTQVTAGYPVLRSERVNQLGQYVNSPGHRAYCYKCRTRHFLPQW